METVLFREATFDTIRDYVEDIGAFLQQVSGPAVLIGHSLGGIIAVATTKAYPHLVCALIVGDAPLDAAGIIGPGSCSTVFVGIKFVVVLRAIHSGTGKTAAVFKTFNGIDAQHGFP